MSAIGSYAVLTRHQFPLCLSRAREVRTESRGKWPFKKAEVVGVDEFKKAWQAALVEEVSFDHSGYVLGNYVDAQHAVNRIHLVNEQSEEARVLNNVFTAAFPFHEVVVPPELASEPLLAFCKDEYGDDARSMVEALAAAHLFYRRGLNSITLENLVVFIIR